MYILHFVWVPLLQIGLGLVFKDVHFILALAVLFLKWSYFDSDFLKISVGTDTCRVPNGQWLIKTFFLEICGSPWLLLVADYENST